MKGMVHGGYGPWRDGAGGMVPERGDGALGRWCKERARWCAGDMVHERYSTWGGMVHGGMVPERVMVHRSDGAQRGMEHIGYDAWGAMVHWEGDGACCIEGVWGMVHREVYSHYSE